jgi:hypothetical protein
MQIPRAGGSTPPCYRTQTQRCASMACMGAWSHFGIYGGVQVTLCAYATRLRRCGMDVYTHEQIGFTDQLEC